MLVETAFFPPLAYMSLLARDMILSDDGIRPSVVTLEACEHYQKQSYRNRCYILAGDGVQMLQVPVLHTQGPRAIREVAVDYSTPWVERLLQAVDTAYYSAPFYEYYRDDFREVFLPRPQTLWSLNRRALTFCLDHTGIACTLQESRSFVPPGSVRDDFRGRIHPKKPHDILTVMGLERPYWQVFLPKFGFTPGLSVLDLLFNEGPDALSWLYRK